jgi:Laminin B (Domain IV)/PEP-CTERM motif
VNVIRLSVVLLAASACAYSAPIVSSTFDGDSDGWLVGDFLTAGGPTTAPVYNAGGYIHADDFAAWSAFHAPAKFLGDLSAAYGATLSFNLRASGVDGPVYSAIVISNGTTTLQFSGLPVAGVWHQFVMPLLASAGWQHSTDGKTAGVAATEAELQAVLASVQFLHINSDWLTGSDSAELDDVQIVNNPEPSTMLLLGTALATLAAFARRRA